MTFLIFLIITAKLYFFHVFHKIGKFITTWQRGETEDFGGENIEFWVTRAVFKVKRLENNFAR